MNYLDLCDFLPEKTNTLQYEAFTFSGGEPHIKLKYPINIKEKVTVIQRIQSFNDLGLLCVAVDALKRYGYTHIEAFIPYFPGARQDRVAIKGEALTVKVYADIINALNLERVTIYDPHSDVTPALLNNCRVYNNFSFIEYVLNSIDIYTGEKVYFVCPDSGANKKIKELALEFLIYNPEIIYCDKTRDVKTGNITGFKVYSEIKPDIPLILIDDICDGGGTFIGLAEEIKKQTAAPLYLAVSHGIFSKGISALKKNFSEVYTTNSFSADISYTYNPINVFNIKL